MSGDLGPRVAISAAQKFLHLYPDVDLFLVGDQEQLQQTLQGANPRINFIHATEVITMDDDPLTALRHKKNSSMWKSLELLRDESADACVSAGNTGALLAIAKYLIKTFPGIERPAICKSMPVSSGVTYLLDLGANIDVSPELLHQFALMGSALAKAFGADQPRVSLLNIGTEAYKGTDILRQAQELLQQDASLNYAGFIEANCIFSGEVDVIVCDGFHGNIALKASEGVAQFIANKISAEFDRHPIKRLLALLCWPMLKHLRAQLNPAQYNGASFLGLQKTVIKSHGSADENAFVHALAVAREQVLLRVPERIHHQFSH
jgi:glycerol-3-phosphate acyltransferase PlsX